MHHYRNLSNRKEAILLAQYKEYNKSRTVTVNTDRYKFVMECFSMMSNTFTDQLCLYSASNNNSPAPKSSIDLRQPTAGVNLLSASPAPTIKGDPTPNLSDMVKNYLERAGKLEVIPHSKPHQKIMYLYIYAIYSALQNANVFSNNDEEGTWTKEEMQEMQFKVSMGLGNALFAVSKLLPPGEIPACLSQAASEFEKAVRVKEDSLDKFIVDTLELTMKNDLAHLLWLTSFSSVLEQRVHYLISSLSSETHKHKGGEPACRYPLIANLDFSQTRLPAKLLSPFLRRYRHDIQSLDFSYCRHFNGEVLVEVYGPPKLEDTTTPTGEVPPVEEDEGRPISLNTCKLSYTIITQDAVDVLLNNCPHLHVLVVDGCPGLLKQPTLPKVEEPKTLSTKKSPTPPTRLSLRETPLRGQEPGLADKSPSRKGEGRIKRSRRELEEKEHHDRMRVEEELKKDTQPSCLQELRAHFAKRKIEVMADTMLKRKIDNGIPGTLSLQWMVRLGNLHALTVHRLIDLEMLNSISRNCHRLEEFHIEDFGSVEVSMHNIGQFCQTFTHLLSHLKSLTICNFTSFVCDSWAFAQWCINKEKSFRLKTLRLTFKVIFL